MYAFEHRRAVCPMTNTTNEQNACSLSARKRRAWFGSRPGVLCRCQPEPDTLGVSDSKGVDLYTLGLGYYCALFLSLFIFLFPQQVLCYPTLFSSDP